MNHAGSFFCLLAITFLNGCANPFAPDPMIEAVPRVAQAKPSVRLSSKAWRSTAGIAEGKIIQVEGVINWRSKKNPSFTLEGDVFCYPATNQESILSTFAVGDSVRIKGEINAIDGPESGWPSIHLYGCRLVK